MFTLKEISDLAVQIETNGEAVYRAVAAKVSDPTLKDILEAMAQDEQQHARWFRRLSSAKLTSQKSADDELGAIGRALLTEMLSDQTFSLSAEELQDVRTMAEVIAQAQEFEKDTIVFYEMLADFVDESEPAAQLREIIAEEYRHIEQLNGYRRE
jgi:rubrerythrin